MARPGRWQSVRTDSGWHLRLMGANGEPVLWSENHPREEGVKEAFQVAMRTITDPAFASGALALEEVDERGEQQIYRARCTACPWRGAWQTYDARAAAVGAHRTSTGHGVKFD